MSNDAYNATVANSRFPIWLMKMDFSNDSQSRRWRCRTTARSGLSLRSTQGIRTKERIKTFSAIILHPHLGLNPLPHHLCRTRREHTRFASPIISRSNGWAFLEQNLERYLADSLPNSSGSDPVRRSSQTLFSAFGSKRNRHECA